MLSAVLGNPVVLLLQKQMYFFIQAAPQTHVLLFFSSCAIQPCCRSDGNSRLEVHGGVSPTSGGRSLPLSGFSPVPFSWTPTQAPQTILTASLLGISTHTHSQAFTHNKPQFFTPDTQDKYSPCCYLLHLPTSCPKALQPHPFLLYLLFVNCEGK